MAKRNWTPEQRAERAEWCRRKKIWLHSTGPRSIAGKAIVSRNTWKGGHRIIDRELTKAMNALIRKWNLERYGSPRSPRF